MKTKFAHKYWYMTTHNENLFDLTPDELSWFKLLVDASWGTSNGF